MAYGHRGQALRRGLVLPLAALAFVVGCRGEPPTLAAADPSMVSEQVFAVGYGRIAEAYLQPVALSRLTTEGLRALAALDPSLRVEPTKASVRLYVSDILAAEYALPEETDAAGWAALTARSVERARLHSAALRDTSTERVYQIVFDAVTATLDGYSRYTGAQRATNERAQREGYGGLGLSLDRVNKRLVVRDVTPRGPADRAGIRDGDHLLAVDGDSTGVMEEAAVRERLRGATGTLVTLTVGRDGAPVRRIPIRRERVVPNTVSMTVADNVGVLKLERFNASTASNLRDSVLAARASAGSKLRGLVLDLRGNPGGLLDQAVAVADLFIPRGRILTTEGRHPDSRQRFDAGTDDVADGLPLVVLVDGRSASSAEIVAAALQDSGRAVVVGASSYGKGSVQTVTRLPNDGELFLTWSRIYTPGGYTLHRQGVQPTVCTSHGDADPLADLRENRIRPFADLASWRAHAGDDEEALTHLREACPWKEHEPDLDVQVARQLLADSTLYQRAVAFASTIVAER